MPVRYQHAKRRVGQNFSYGPFELDRFFLGHKTPWLVTDWKSKERATPENPEWPILIALFLRVGSTNLRHVLRGGTLLALHDVELDLLALGERLEAAAID